MYQEMDPTFVTHYHRRGTFGTDMHCPDVTGQFTCMGDLYTPTGPMYYIHD